VTRALVTGVIGCALLAVACRPEVTVPGPQRPAPRAAESQPGENWPISAEQAEHLFSVAPLEFVAYEPMAEGVADAVKARLFFPSVGRWVKVKWKAAPSGDFDGWNNNPRKEIACYAIQQWFLDPKDYVVPTVALRCVPLTAFGRLNQGATPSMEGTQCVLGTISLWLDDVEVPKKLYDPVEFARDRWYAYHFSNFNVFAYLVEHRDARGGNLLVPDDDDEPRRVYAVDNGISFGELVYNFLVRNWDVIRVPAIRKEVVDRLRTVDQKRLETLGTLVELVADGEGGMRPVRGGRPIDRDKGVRVTKDRVQMGLTRAEIHDVERRLKDLLQRVDGGTLAVF
jgi:hypothetical protein